MAYPYTVKKIKEMPTPDGGALSADLYRGSKKIGFVHDHGTGGGIWPTTPDPRERADFDTWVATLGTVSYPAENGEPPFTTAADTETATDMLVFEAQAILERARLDRKARTHLVYRQADEEEGTCRLAPLPEMLLGKDLALVVAAYRKRAPWFATVTQVWQRGQGWTDVGIF